METDRSFKHSRCREEGHGGAGPSQAAVASRTAGELYGMEVLAEEVNNVKGNTTRFLILGKEPVYAKKAGKISVAFEIPHKSGSLYNILETSSSTMST